MSCSMHRSAGEIAEFDERTGAFSRWNPERYDGMGTVCRNMEQFAETKFAEIGKMSLSCPVCRKKIRASGKKFDLLSLNLNLCNKFE